MLNSHFLSKIIYFGLKNSVIPSICFEITTSATPPRNDAPKQMRGNLYLIIHKPKVDNSIFINYTLQIKDER